MSAVQDIRKLPPCAGVPTERNATVESARCRDAPLAGKHRSEKPHVLNDGGFAIAGHGVLPMRLHGQDDHDAERKYG